MNEPARRRKAVLAAIGALATCALAATVMVYVAPASADSGSAADKYGVLNGTVAAGTDHEIAGSSAFPNFTNGAVDNYYSMSYSHVDNSPFAEGMSSPADTGPLGQTAAAGNTQQPQYADARWPGNSGTATFGQQGGPYAEAAADSYKATASSEEVSQGSSTAAVAAPAGFSADELRVALTAWKAQWLPKLGLTSPPLPVVGSALVPPATVPAVTLPTFGGSSSTQTTTASTTTTSSTTTSTTPSPPPPNAALGSSTEATLAPDSGALVTSGESSLGRVSLAGGQIVIAGIDVSASITNSGTPTDKVAIDVGAASIAGVPVTIDQNGVAVAGQTVPLAAVYAQADSALNSVLKQAGIQLFTVQPEVVKSANEETLTATGVHVTFTQPIHQGGVPDQFVEHILGEVFVDSLAVPGMPVPSLNLSGTGSSSGGSGGKATSSGASRGGSSTGGGGVATGGGSATGFPASSSPTSQPASGSSGAPAQQAGPLELVSAIGKPTWLLISYFLWQALVIGTGATLWSWRRGGLS